MQHSDLVVPHMDTANQAFDLANALMAISGIAHIGVDHETHTVAVDYDSDYLSEDSLKEIMKGSGYPSTGDENSR